MASRKNRSRGAGERAREDATSGEVVEGEVVDGEIGETTIGGEVVDGDVVEARSEASDDRDAQGDDEIALEGEVLEGEVTFDAEVLPPRATRGDTTDIARLDPLQAYMRDVQRYSLLSLEDTHELAVRYVETGDVEAARKLVTANLRLVVKIAFDYRRAYRNILDLIQEGNIGLMQAVTKYDPYRGVRLSSYAAWWIRAYILRFILNNWRLVKVGTTQAQRKLFFNLKKEKARLAAMGIDPTPEVIAKRLDVPVAEVVSMDRRLSAGEVSLDAPLPGGDGGRERARVDLVPATGQLADEALAQAELDDILTAKIHEFGATLTGKDAIIFHERLVADEPKTLQELGDRFGVTRERVRQLEKRLQGKIRKYLEAEVEGSALPSSQ